MIYFRDIVLETSDDVYEPAEDSFLIAENPIISPGDVAADIGTGCGICAIALASLAKRVLAVDINDHALLLCEKNFRLNRRENFEVRKSDLFENIHKGEIFNVILFNPPYIPESGQYPGCDHDMLARSWNGGKGGIEIIKRFVEQVGIHLEQGGSFYIVISSLNPVEKVRDIFQENGFKFEKVKSKKLWFEELFLVKGSRTCE